MTPRLLLSEHPQPLPTHVKTSPERLRTHAVHYAENLWLPMHIPHYGLTVAMTYLEKAEMDGQMEGGGGIEARYVL